MMGANGFKALALNQAMAARVCGVLRDLGQDDWEEWEDECRFRRRAASGRRFVVRVRWDGLNIHRGFVLTQVYCMEYPRCSLAPSGLWTMLLRRNRHLLAGSWALESDGRLVCQALEFFVTEDGQALKNSIEFLCAEADECMDVVGSLGLVEGIPLWE
ncbi:MAG: hypothetical protein L0Z62_15330 [Gemmataceae bacterium]|nr:hypothetical protein [Gemmataceae bacterium]